MVEDLLRVLLQQVGSIYPCLNWLYGEITDTANPVEVEILAFTPSHFQAVYQGMRVPILQSGFSHRLYEQRQISYVGEDTDTLSLLHPQFVETFALTSFMGVPLLFEDRVIGALFAATFKGEAAQAPDAGQLEALQDIARVGALALHRMKAQAALEEQIRRVSRLNERLRGLQISLSEVAVQQDLGRVLRTLLELVQESTDLRFWIINGINDEGTSLDLLASVGFPKEAAPPPQIQVGGLESGVSGRAAAEGRIVVARDIALDPHCQAYLPFLEPYGIRSAFSMPLKSRGGEVLGVLTGYATTEGVPTEETLSQVEMLSVLATLAIERFHLWSRLQKELQQRRESEALYKTLVEESLTGVYLIQDGVFTFANRAMQELFGYTEAELFHRSVSDLVAPADYPRVLDALRRRVSGEIAGAHYTFDAVRKDGNQVPVEVHGSRVDLMGRPAVLGVVMDITDRLRAQDLLRSSAELARILVESAQAMTLALDEDGLLRALFDGAARLTGMANWWHNRYEPAAKTSITSHWTPGLDRYLTPEQIRKPVTLEDFPGLERLHLAKESVWFARCEADPQFTPDYLALVPHRSLAGVPLLHEGEAVGVLLGGTLGEEGWRELAEPGMRALESLGATAGLALNRLRDRAAMEASEERYRQLFDQSADAVLLADASGFVMGNEAAAQLFGVPRESIRGRQVGDFSPEFQPGGERSEELARRLEQEAMDGQVLVFPWLNVRADGNLVHTEIKLGCVEHRGRRLLQVILRDMTEAHLARAENENLQRQLFQAQKMESLGVLAGGIAHDFNNLLMGVLGYAGLAADHVDPAGPAVGYLKAIEAASLRAVDLTRQLLAYTGRGQFQVENLDLSFHVEGMAHLLEVSISKQATLQLDLANGLPLLQGDPAQIQQVIMNLLINAGEAIEARDGESGLIRLATALEQLDEAQVRALREGPPLSAGSYVMLEVSDTGIGMDESTLSHMFEPFFTTKFTGRGLGLSAIVGIVRGHKGGLAVTSQPGRGTNFRIYFPALGAGVPAPVPIRRLAGTLPADEGLILVVDDEDSVRDVASECLRVGGYRVLEAASGFQALDLMDRHGAEVALVLLDMTMPEMGGEATLREINAHWPSARVLLSSGFPASALALKLDGTAPDFIQKPYTPQDIQDKVQGILGIPRSDS